MQPVLEFWRGEVPLGRAFWVWAGLGGALVNLAATLLAFALLSAGAPGWLGVLAFIAPIPWNLVLLVGVWRSAERGDVDRLTASGAQLLTLLWVIALCLV